MFVINKRITWSDGGNFTDLFDDGKPQTIAAGILCDLIKTMVEAALIQWLGMPCITDDEPVVLQYDIDGPAWDIVVAGIAEQVIQQYIYQFRIGLYHSFFDPALHPDLPALP